MKRIHLGEPDVNINIILKWIFNKIILSGRTQFHPDSGSRSLSQLRHNVTNANAAETRYGTSRHLYRNYRIRVTRPTKTAKRYQTTSKRQLHKRIWSFGTPFSH